MSEHDLLPFDEEQMKILQAYRRSEAELKAKIATLEAERNALQVENGQLDNNLTGARERVRQLISDLTTTKALLETDSEQIRGLLDTQNSMMHTFTLLWHILYPGQEWEYHSQVYQHIRQEIEELHKQIESADDARLYYRGMLVDWHLPWRVEYDHGKAIIRNAQNWILAEFTLGSGPQAELAVKAVNQLQGASASNQKPPEIRDVDGDLRQQIAELRARAESAEAALVAMREHLIMLVQSLASLESKQA